MQISSIIAALQRATPQLLEEAPRSGQLSFVWPLVGVVLFVLLSTLVVHRLSPMRKTIAAWFVSGVLSLVSIVLVTVFMPNLASHFLNAVLDIIHAVRQ